MEKKNNIIIRFTKSSKRISLSELAKIITEGKYIEKWVMYHRSQSSATGKTDKRLSEIPTIQPNSEEDYNGLACLIIKGKNNEDLEHLANQLTDDKHTRLCAINTFLHQIVLITCYALDNDDAPYPTAPLMVRMFHREAYALAIEHYAPIVARNVGVEMVIGTSLPDMSFHCPADEKVFFNPHSVVTRIPQPIACRQRSILSAIERQPSGNVRSLSAYNLFHECLNHVLRDGYRTDNEEELPLFLAQIAKECYRAGVPEAELCQWLTIELYGNAPEELNIIISDLYAMQKGGFGTSRDMSRSMRRQYEIEHFLRNNYDIRKNEISDILECRSYTAVTREWHPLDDGMVSIIYTQALKTGIDKLHFSDIQHTIATYLHTADFYCPPVDYLSSLPEWDGINHIDSLFRRIPCKNQKFLIPYLHKWFLSMVVMWLGIDPEHGNALVPLLVGPEGCGKGEFYKNLLPKELRKYVCENFDLSTSRKSQLALTRYLLIVMDEFDQISDSKQPQLKNLLQMADIKTARPYGTHDEQMRRFASLFATSNMRQILPDQNGGRRFICININGDIDNAPVDHAQLYAQAIYEIKQGMQHWLTREEEKALMEYNQQFAKSSIEVERFVSKYTKADSNDDDALNMSATEIMTLLEFAPKEITRKRVIALGQFLSAHGFQRHLKDGITKYYFKQRKASE